MNVINNLNFKNTIFLYLAILCLFVSSCKRVVKADDEAAAESDNAEAVSKAQMQKVMAMKLPLKTVTIDKIYNLTIPQSANFEVSKVEPNDETKIGKIGNIDLTKLPEPYLYVTLNNTFTHHDELYNEYIVIFKENDTRKVSIKDIKESYGDINFVYFEDDNSLVFDQGDSFCTIHFDYDEANKSYIFYRSEMSWSKKYPKKQKVDLCLHLLKQAKNLINHSYTNTQFTSWDDYVQNMPVIETELVKGIFKKLEKELKIFLEENEKVSPKTPGNYTFVSLYRATKPKEQDFHKFLDAVKANQVNSYDFGGGIHSVNKEANYQVKQQEGSFLIDFSSKRYSGEIYKSGVTIVCPINYKNKTFFIQTADEVPQSDTDIYVKMFSYFSKNYTLDTKSN